MANLGKQNVKLDGPKVKSGGHDPVLDMRTSACPEWMQDPFNCDNIRVFHIRTEMPILIKAFSSLLHENKKNPVTKCYPEWE